MTVGDEVYAAQQHRIICHREIYLFFFSMEEEDYFLTADGLELLLRSLFPDSFVIESVPWRNNGPLPPLR